MVQLEELTFQSFLYKAIEKVNTIQEEQLISWTEKIHPLDLLTVFAVAEEMNEDRVFWSNSSNDFALVGIGSVHKLIADQNRYEQLQEKWQQLVDQAMIYNPFEEAGTGLISVGGMSFDPRRPKSVLWEKYPTSQLTIPEYVIIENKGTYFMTVNLLVEQNISAEQIMQDIEAT